MRPTWGRLLAASGLLASVSGLLAGEARAAIPVAERTALIALYNSTNGAGWSNHTNWRNAADSDFNDPGTECTWYGVLCTGDNVTGLDLAGNNVSGPLPPEIGNFTELLSLRIYNTGLTGAIPAAIASLSKLQDLQLANNQLSGPIPASLGTLGQLRELMLYSNQLSGSIPASLGSLASLERLYVGTNQLTGSIPASLGSLTALRELEMGMNPLTGPIPPEIGNLASLRFLSVQYDQLDGPIPPELGALGNLENLWAPGNRLSGSIPPQLGNLAKIESLVLWGNELDGPIPPELGVLTTLKGLSLGNNQLSGSIPDLSALTVLQSLDLSENQLTGTIPASIGALASLRSLRLHMNQLTGSIPAALGNLTQLTELLADGNQLSGSIPPELGGLTNLTDLRLGWNQLSGAIPSQLGNLANVTYFSLADNQLTGSIPSTLGNLASMETLELTRNHLDGSIPASLGSLPAVLHLNLGSNRLSGLIPKELGGLSSLTSLGLYSNQLIGEIPPELASLTSVTWLNLNWNGLHTSDPVLAAFLDARAWGWDQFQTVAPTGVAAGPAASGSVLLSWTPILYTSDDGGYRVRYGTTAGGPYPDVFGPTATKEAASTFVTGLVPETTYFFVVETITEAHGNNENSLTSGPSAEVTAHTAGPSPVTYVLAVTKAGTGSGRVTSVPAGIDCGTDCDEVIVGDSVVTLTATADPGSVFLGWGGGCTGAASTCDVVVETADVAVTATFEPIPPTSYYTVTPCRAYDTRVASLGGPAPLAAGTDTDVMLVGRCDIPAGATAVSLNLTATRQTELGHLRIYPAGVSRPNASTLNYGVGQTRANNAIVPLSATGELTIYVGQAGGTTHVIIDVNGFYAQEATADAPSGDRARDPYSK